MQLARFLVSTLAVMALVSPTATADTALLLQGGGQLLFGVNVDGVASDGLVVFNARDVRRTAIIEGGGIPAVWTSTHASATITQLGPGLPMGGVNEAGLVIQAGWLDVPGDPVTDPSPLVESLQWIQYCLDTFETSAQVVQSAIASRVVGKAPIHFLACDRSGRCGMLERADGRTVIRAAEELPLPVITGISYRESLDFLNRSLGYGGKPVPIEGDASGPRFARAAKRVNLVRTGEQPIAPADLFSALDDLVVGSSTWQFGFDLNDPSVIVARGGSAGPWKVALSDRELDCAPGVPTVATLSTVGDDAVDVGQPRRWDADSDSRYRPSSPWTAKVPAAKWSELVEQLGSPTCTAPTATTASD